MASPGADKFRALSNKAVEGVVEGFRHLLVRTWTLDLAREEENSGNEGTCRGGVGVGFRFP